MKILKKAVQKNVVLAKENYTVDEINSMLNERKIFYFDEKNLVVCYDEVSFFGKYDDTEFRIFTDKLIELKIILDENGHYKSVGIGKDGYKYFVDL